MKTLEQRVSEIEQSNLIRQKEDDTTFAVIVSLRADIESMEEMFSMITEKLGWKKQDAAVLLELRRRFALKKLEEILISIEDKSPAYAAKLQEIIDERRREV